MTCNSYTQKELLNHIQSCDREAKCNSHKTMSFNSAGNCVSPRLEMLFHGHTITKRRPLDMIWTAKQLIPKRSLNYPILTNHIHRKNPYHQAPSLVN